MMLLLLLLVCSPRTIGVRRHRSDARQSRAGGNGNRSALVGSLAVLVREGQARERREEEEALHWVEEEENERVCACCVCGKKV